MNLAMTPKPIGVIVTGATGWVGSRVAASLSAAGVPVIAVGRIMRPGPWMAFHEGDLASSRFSLGDGLATKLSAADSWALVHCGGYVHQQHESADVRRRMHEVNAVGTRHVVELCQTLGITRMVYVSSIAVYDWANLIHRPPPTESASVGPSTAYAESKLAGEEATRCSGLDWQIVRLATVFGNGDQANFASLARAIRSRVFVLPGAAAAKKSVIDVQLAGRCLAELSVAPAFSRQTLNLALEETPSLATICREFAIACDFRVPRSAPLWLLTTAAAMGDFLQAAGMTAPLTSTQLMKLTTSTAVDCSLAVAHFPTLLTTSFRSAITAASSYYKHV